MVGVVLDTLLIAVFIGLASLVDRNIRDYSTLRGKYARETRPTFIHPGLTVIVPARNEEDNIEACVEALMAQEYQGLTVRVVDDASTDRTGEILDRLMRKFPRLSVVTPPPKPESWAGKAHACHHGALGVETDWLMFVDADTRTRPQLARIAVEEAESLQLDLLSTLPHQEIGSMGEALTVPMIFWVLFTLLPIRQVWESPDPRFAAACGQFLLVRRSAYEAAGGHAHRPDTLHDGLHLARRFKTCGLKVGLCDLSDWITCRMYRGFGESWTGFSRNAYQALESPSALILVTGIEFVLFLFPYLQFAVGLAMGWVEPLLFGAIQSVMLLTIASALRRRFRLPRFWVMAHPISVALLIAIQWNSAIRCWLRLPTRWKARAIPMPGGSRGDAGQR